MTLLLFAPWGIYQETLGKGWKSPNFQVTIFCFSKLIFSGPSEVFEAFEMSSSDETSPKKVDKWPSFGRLYFEKTKGQRGIFLQVLIYPYCKTTQNYIQLPWRQSNEKIPPIVSCHPPVWLRTAGIPGCLYSTEHGLHVPYFKKKPGQFWLTCFEFVISLLCLRLN